MRRMRMLSVSSVVMLLLVGMVGSAQAADPVTTVGGVSAEANATPSATPGGHFAPYPYDQGTVSTLGESGVITAGTCQYKQATDLPHLSSGDTSIHGWWLIAAGSGACPSKAKVTLYLQAWYCNSSCWWATLTVDADTVFAGGGSANRANTRWACANSNEVGWRGFVDVDLENWSDPAGYYYSPIVNLLCSPS